MHLLCKLFGHKPSKELQVDAPYHDGILRSHRWIYASCTRCNQLQQLGKFIDQFTSGDAPHLWKSILIDALVVAHIYQRAHETDPLKALMDLLNWETAVALDPAVSKQARDLRDGFAAAGKLYQVQWHGTDEFHTVAKDVYDNLGDHGKRIIYADPDRMDAAAMMLHAYARGEGYSGGQVRWEDLNDVFEQAQKEHPGRYEDILKLYEEDPEQL